MNARILTIYYNKQPPVTVKTSVFWYDFVSMIRFKGSLPAIR